jgi:hypothetical protein
MPWVFLTYCKRKSIPEDNDELTDQEAEIAFGIAENAGTVISLQLLTVWGGV